MTIDQSITAFLEDLAGARRSANTVRAYKNGLNNFRGLLQDKGLDPATATPAQLTEQHVRDFLSSLGAEHAKATLNLYLAAVRAYVEFLDEQELVPQINTSRLARQLRKRMPRPGRRLPQFPREEIEKVLTYAESLVSAPADDEQAYFLNLRDRAFILTLADTGLRVHEACALKRKDVDWNEGRAVIIGKGDKEAVVRFSTRALEATKHYLNERSKLDQGSGRQLATLPIFTGHGRSNLKKAGGGLRFRHMTTETGRALIRQRVQECLGAEMVGQITPHSFRHYFVTIVLHATGGNIRIAQELARHSSISTTQRYTHLVAGELDEAYHETFNRTG
jgi:site-specific recombinase XerD